MGNIRMGKSGTLRVATVAAARALMAQDVAEGRRETPDVGAPHMLSEISRVLLKRSKPSLGLEPGAIGAVAHAYANYLT